MRLAFVQGKNGKPSILITKNLDIYLGNLGSDGLVVHQGELFGFYTGTFESKIISGPLVIFGVNFLFLR